MPNPDTLPREPESANGDESRSLNELRELLFAQEQQEIRVLREHLENAELHARDVSTILARAIRIRQENKEAQDELNDSLIPSIERGLCVSVRRNPAPVADALYPAIGPTIRKSVRALIEEKIQSLNQTLQNCLSWQGLKWRWEALRTGQPFSEVVLLRNLIYRVEQVFLIHQETGLLLHHVVSPEVMTIQDPAMVSGMLTAIQDFVRDSFAGGRQESLDNLRVGDHQVWVESGRLAAVAIVIRGNAPEQLRERLQKLVVQVHRRLGQELETFKGDAGPFTALHEELVECLHSQHKTERKGRPKPYFLAISCAIALSILLWFGYREWEYSRWNQFVGNLSSQPGIVITRFQRKDGKFLVEGLKDPLSPDPIQMANGSGLRLKGGEFRFRSFYSLDDTIVAARAAMFLQAPSSVHFSYQSGVLQVFGKAPAEWIRILSEQSRWIPGIRQIDASGLENQTHTELSMLQQRLESTLILFDVADSRIRTTELQRLKSATEDITGILKIARSLGEDRQILVIGKADDTGAASTNRILSQSRAESIIRALVDAGIDHSYLRQEAEPASNVVVPPGETLESTRREFRSVSFRVVLRR